MSDTLFAGDDRFWEIYRKGRPQIPDSFFQRICDYHLQRGGDFITVHDAGAGGGVHSARLAQHFENVLVTDVSESNIETARSHLRGQQYSFKAVRLEETIDLPPASVDMVFVSAALHFTDIGKALNAVAHQLKPRGTFAASVHGIPTFTDADVHDKFATLFHAGWEQFRHTLGEDLMPAHAINASGYDRVALPESIFLPDSLRIRLNEDSQLMPGGGTFYEMMTPPQWREEFPLTSRVGLEEKVVLETDDDWTFQADINFMRQLHDTFPFDLETFEMKRLWMELAKAVGERKVEGRWVVYLILATRK